MTQPKYTLLLEDTITVQETTLYRIKALRSFGDVTEGDLGGYLQSSSNLSHEGYCWVGGDARVFGNAWVYGDARVCGDAQVYGDAWVSEDALVYGNARVCGDAQVSGNARASGNARVYENALVDGDAQVYGHAWVRRNTNLTTGHHTSGHIIESTTNDTSWATEGLT